MKKVVWISAYIPYENVNHAGGKIHYYYINRLIDTKKFDIRLISFYTPDEVNKFSLYNKIQCDLFCYHTGIKKLIRGIREINYKHNPLHKYGNIANRYSHHNILKKLQQYKEEGYCPDIIILQWTQIVVFIKEIKEIFPDAKCVSIEEDVALLSYKRMRDSEKNRFKKYLYKLRYKKLEKSEIEALSNSDLVILNNDKDRKLLKNYSVLDNKTIKVWAPYYDSYLEIERIQNAENSIMFYGAMNRPENYLSVIWFIEKVLPIIKDDYVFYVVGGKPNERLLAYQSEKIIITGFVENVAQYLQKCKCLVAPLVLGAGIKIKILEALSAGIPVLTNSIGIEGIPAKTMQEYYHCEAPEEYATIIHKIFGDKYDSVIINHNAKKFVSEHFDYNKSGDDFVEWVDSLC